MRRRFALCLFAAAAACHTPPPTAPAAPAGAGMQVQVVRLEHAQAAAVAERVQESLAQHPAPGSSCRIVAQPEQNALVVSGTTAELRAVLDLVGRLDRPSAR